MYAYMYMLCICTVHAIHVQYILVCIPDLYAIIISDSGSIPLKYLRILHFWLLAVRMEFTFWTIKCINFCCYVNKKININFLDTQTSELFSKCSQCFNHMVSTCTCILYKKGSTI